MEEKDIKVTGEMDINSDSDVPGTTHLKDPVEGKTDSERLETELAETRDKYLRLVAEFDNFRKRTSKEKLELIQTAGKEVIGALLEVLDDADRAQKQLGTAADISTAREGLKLVFNKLRSILQAKGLKPMESIGSDFDPDKHEAITEIPAPTADMKGKVLDEVEKGYYLNDKIIRFAKVVVGK